MSLQRYDEPTGSLANDHHYMDRLPAMAEQLAQSSMCPEAFRGKPADIAIIGYVAADLGLRLNLTVLSQFYVIKGRAGMMAQIQSGLAGRAGYDIRPVSGKCDERAATVRVVTPHGEQHFVTFTIEEAARAKMTGSGTMYEKWPASMLVARATTRAISWHCPEVKLGLTGTADMAEVDAIDIVARDQPAASATDRERRRFRALVAALDDEQKDEVRARLKAEGIPPIGHPDLTSEQAQKAEAILFEVEDDWAAVTAQTAEDLDEVEAELVPDPTDEPSGPEPEPYAPEEEPF